eukprot:g6075.t1
MANSRFQYVKKFELSDALLPDTYLIARLDGHRFTKFTAEHGYTKPNDERGLLLMAECARQVMSEWSDLVMAFGQSDEFSFLLPASSPLYGRRSAKLSTSFVSLFSSSFVFFWPKHFPNTPLLYPPNFDARIVSYPSAEHVRDYFAWRQADCHINNLYNTCFWALVTDGVSKQDAQVALKGTTSGDKNELLFSRFDTNYNNIPQRFRKVLPPFQRSHGERAPPTTPASKRRAKGTMGEAPFRLVATLLLVTHIVAAAFSSLVLGAIPSWIARLVIVVISTRMFFVRDMDNSVYQEIIMVWCFFVAAVDLFWAWAWLDLGLNVARDWAGACTQLVAAFASVYAAKVHIPSNILEDRRRFTALLLLVTHGVAFFFGAPFYPGFQWLAYLVGVALSARLFSTKVEDVNLVLGILAIITCLVLVAADVWIVVWSLTPREDDDLPRKWVMIFPNAVAAVASAYTTYTLVQDRKLLANILVTV